MHGLDAPPCEPDRELRCETNECESSERESNRFESNSSPATPVEIRRPLAVSVLAACLALMWTWGVPAVADQTDPRLDPLFASLRSARNSAEAETIAAEIWDIWHQADDPVTALLMSQGAAAMQAGDAAAALEAYDAVIESAPRFAEGWNRRATLYYLIGQFDASVADIEKTLALEPRHFGALSGLALIREAEHKWFEALEALDKVSRIHPKMPQLQERLDQLSRQLGEAI
jgi:tetratricopeptide (TPR) repeat protein